MSMNTSQTPANSHDKVECSRVLFVDLDGTLVSTDLLHEGLIQASKTRVQSLARVLWLFVLRENAAAKRLLTEGVTPDFHRLPFRDDVLEFLAKQRAQGVTLILATATDRCWAEKMAEITGLFDVVLASDGVQNLKGQAKLEAVQAYCRQEGFDGFDYAGDSAADLVIWKRARKAYVANPSSRLLQSMRQVCQPICISNSSPHRAAAIVSALRPLQWLKNLLVFVPLIFAHEFSNIEKLIAAVLAFMAFSCCASGMYVVNDLLDIESDRHHPNKRNRPFASGAAPVAWGPPTALLCISTGLLLGLAFLSLQFFALLVGYVIVSGMYSLWLKKIVILDVLLLSGFYNLRIMAGGMATEILVSEWLLGFSIFLFLSLALAKRYSELARLVEENAVSVKGRGYRVSDVEFIGSIGPTNAFLAVLVFALYVHSEQASRIYSNEWALWLICPLLIYWVSRLWLMVKRQELTEDPLLFAVKDPVSLIVGVLVAILIAFARPL